MAPEKESFVFYRSFYEALQELSSKQRLHLYEAIIEYGINEIEPKLTGIEKSIFTLIKPQIDSSRKRYEKCVENGKKGGRPKNQIDMLGFENEKPKENQIGFKDKKPKQNLNYNDNVNDNDNDNVNVNDNVSDSCVDGLQNVIDFYEKNVGMVTPYTLEVLEDYAKEMPEDLIIFAMKKATEANIRTIKYIKGILNSWSKKGIKTVIEAKKEDENFRNKDKKETKKEERQYTSDELNALYANQGGNK